MVLLICWIIFLFIFIVYTLLIGDVSTYKVIQKIPANNGKEFNKPIGIAFNSADGTIYVADSLNHKVKVIDKKGNLLLYYFVTLFYISNLTQIKLIPFWELLKDKKMAMQNMMPKSLHLGQLHYTKVTFLLLRKEQLENWYCEFVAN